MHPGAEGVGLEALDSQASLLTDLELTQAWEGSGLCWVVSGLWEGGGQGVCAQLRSGFC